MTHESTDPDVPADELETPPPPPVFVGAVVDRRVEAVRVVLTWRAPGAPPIDVVRIFPDWWLQRFPADDALGAAIGEAVAPILAMSTVTRELDATPVPWDELAQAVRRQFDLATAATRAEPADGARDGTTRPSQPSGNHHRRRDEVG